VFNKIGVPAGCVLSVPQALALPQVAQRGLLKTFDDVPGIDRPLTIARTGFRLSDGDPDVGSPPPVLGAHTDEVLRDVGFSAGEIEQLRAKGAV
jgi:crotonobetainyl-CoA:carnitine CoA-transferase CaiB-like acyl-CoA transferase